MVYRARVNFLWHRQGDSIDEKEVQKKWVEDGLVEKVSGKASSSKAPAASKEESKPADFAKELESIDGIGKKTAKDIAKVFPDRESLASAVKNDDDLPFRDDVVEKLKEKFSE